MKLKTLSEKILKFMVESYITNDNELFPFDSVKDNFPDSSDEILSKAIYLLQHDGFVTVYPGDDVAYMTELLPDGIRQSQDDTLLKKGYSFLKELKTLLP